MQKFTFPCKGFGSGPEQLLKIMRISICIFSIAACSVQLLLASPGHSQAIMEKKIVLEIRNAPLRQALNKLSDVSGIGLTYALEQVEPYSRVSLPKAKRSVAQTLQVLLSGTDLSFAERGGNTILVFREKQDGKKAANGSLTGGPTSLSPADGKIKREIKGQVLDEKGEGLPGVSIVVKGTQRGTITDTGGNYVLEIPEDVPAVLVFSFVGYVTREIEHQRENMLTVRLTPESEVLEEVVVVGYGTQKKSDLTGSVSSISVDDLQHLPVSSFDRALQGRAAGVHVTQTSGQPGAPVSIRIRGGNSVTGGNEPLYVIDGFPIYNNNSDISTGVVSGPGINALASLNASDIESIHILKDASATAIYGSRGANGVVIITTKKGKAGQNVISYETYYGMQKVVRTLPVLTNSRDFGLLKNDARANAGRAPAFTAQELEEMRGGTDWQQEAFRTAPIRNHQLLISGGDDKTRYALSGNYFKQDGILLNTDFERLSARLNLDRDFSRKFKIGTSLNMSKFSSQAANNDVVRGLLLMPPNVPVKDENGVFTYQSAFETPLGNPVATLLHEINHTKTYRFMGNVYGEYLLADGLTAKVSFGADILNNKQNRYIPSTIYQGVNASTHGTARVGGKFVTTWLNENTLNYVKTLGNKHSVNILAGFTQQAYTNESVTAGSQQFINDLLAYNNLGSGSVYMPPSSGAVEWALKSYLGRVNYSFANRYLLTASIRADGSSRFGEGKKWGYFPSAAVAWNIIEEGFLPLPAFVSNLKVRASAGVTGNQEIGQYLSLATLTNNTYFFGDQVVTGFSPNRISNPYLGWEKTAQYDIGADLSLLKNRIDVVFDYYYKRTTDLLLNIPIPYTTGQSTSVQNYGAIENKGIELTVSFRNLQGAFGWNSSLVFSRNRNKILSLGDDADYIISGASIAKVGEPMGSFYGYRSIGLFQSEAEIAGSPTIDPLNTRPGDQRYLDISGPDGTPDGIISQTYDRVVIGNAQPVFQGGVSNSFSYKGIELSVFFQGCYGNRLFNENRQQLEVFSGQQNASVTALERWTPQNPGSSIPRAFENPAVTNSDRFVEDASFLRLKNLTLGYTIPVRFSSAIGLKHVKVYVAAQNAITWTKYSGYDPEVSRDGQNTLRQGIDYSVYPNNKSYQAGLSISF